MSCQRTSKWRMQVARLRRNSERLIAFSPVQRATSCSAAGLGPGKTFVLCRAVLQRATNAPGSRHVIVRFRFNHAKTSVWSGTLPKVLALCSPSVRVRFDKTDFYVELPNGIADLDCRARREDPGAGIRHSLFQRAAKSPGHPSTRRCLAWRRSANSLQRSPPRQAERM